MAYIPKPTKKRIYSKDLKREDRQKIYQHRRWRPLREAYLAENPLCERCLELGKTTSAVDVHHRTSFLTATDPDVRYHLAFDYSNLQALCQKCHQHIHNKK